MFLRVQFMLSCLFLISPLARGDGLQDIETCSIKEELACSGPLHPGDKSYTFSLGTQLDSDRVFKNQFGIYQDLRKRLHEEPRFPIFVIIREKESYQDLIKRKFDEFFKKTEAKSFESLKSMPIPPENLLPAIKSLPQVLRSVLFQAIPYSRFRIPNEAYTEWVLFTLQSDFPRELDDISPLTQEQREKFVRYGALSVLIAQGLAKNVKWKHTP